MRKAQWWERGGTSSTMSCCCLIETCVSAEPLQRLLYRWLDVQFDENPWAKTWILNLEFWGNCQILWPTFQRSPRTTTARCLCALLVPRKLSETYWNILKPSKIPKSHLIYTHILYESVWYCMYIYTLYIYICTYEQRPTRFMKPLHERSFGGTCCPNHGKQYGELLKSITWFDGEVERCWCVSQPCGIVQ